MAKNKLKLGVLFGGKSAEHDVSLVSAQNIIDSLDKNKYQIFPIKIDRDGEFDLSVIKKMDAIFPVLHGPFGEDGSMQGLLKILDVPFVGPSVLGSAVSMDKDVMKRLLKEAGIPIGKYILVRNKEKISYKEVSKKLGKIMFIKPANLGSSVGIHKVKNEKEFKSGIKDAFKYDNKIIIEEFIDGREFAVAILGNEKPKASTVCEVATDRNFYDYEAKYSDEHGATIEIPAKISKDLIKKAQDISIEVYKVLDCEGMSRVDLFLDRKSKKFIVCELNTIPGFTSHSMYPKLWEAGGIFLPELLDNLIDLALERYIREKKLKVTVK